jgi:hypothetical protein
MSSDSGESHSSAHNHHGDEMEIVEGAKDASTAQEDDIGDSVAGAHGTEEEEEEDAEDVQSVGGGAEALTFARTRRRIPKEEAQDTASDLAARPRIERPQSPASSDIPDDTPSLQVWS